MEVEYGVIGALASQRKEGAVGIVPHGVDLPSAGTPISWSTDLDRRVFAVRRRDEQAHC